MNVDEETKKALDFMNEQIRVLITFYQDLQKRLDAVQDLAITVSAFARATERVLQEHLALAATAETHALAPAARPRPGPEVG